MAARRSFPLALPAGDPRSARIWELLDGLDEDADRSAELRRLICEALDQAARLAAIEAKLDRLLAGGLALAAPAEPEISAEDVADLLGFD